MDTGAKFNIQVMQRIVIEGGCNVFIPICRGFYSTETQQLHNEGNGKKGISVSISINQQQCTNISLIQRAYQKTNGDVNIFT